MFKNYHKACFRKIKKRVLEKSQAPLGKPKAIKRCCLNYLYYVILFSYNFLKQKERQPYDAKREYFRTLKNPQKHKS